MDRDLLLVPTELWVRSLKSKEKTAHEQFVIISEDFQVRENNGKTFFAAKWASVQDDMREEENWTFYEEKMVLDENGL